MEKPIPENVDSVELPISLVFRPVNSVTELETYNISQFKRDATGKAYFEGNATVIKTGDIVTAVKKQDNIDGKNYWITEGGLMIPKEADLFKITSEDQTVSDVAPVIAPAVIEDEKEAVEVEDKYYLIRGGYPLAGAIIGAFSAYKIAICTGSKRAKLIGFVGALIGAGAGYGVSKVHFKFAKTS